MTPQRRRRIRLAADTLGIIVGAWAGYLAIFLGWWIFEDVTTAINARRARDIA